ncbi:MAG: DUF86 domain-containing protein [Patescibacteria group bacterium]|nr:DUF86 domain-containing protein [Patescibacteria group bacterium]
MTPKTLNPEARNLLEKKLGLLKGYMDKLERYVVLGTDEILENDDKLLAMERAFQLVVDEAIDINSVLAYQLGNTVPDAYKSTFYDLVPIGVIDVDFADKISESAKVRNRLTHEYDNLTNKETVESIKKFFEMYKMYTKTVVEKVTAG